MKYLNQYDCMLLYTNINTEGITYDDFKERFRLHSECGKTKNEQFILTGTCEECGKRFKESHDIYATYQKLKFRTYSMCSMCKRQKDKMKHAMYAAVYRGNGC